MASSRGLWHPPASLLWITLLSCAFCASSSLSSCTRLPAFTVSETRNLLQRQATGFKANSCARPPFGHGVPRTRAHEYTTSQHLPSAWQMSATGSVRYANHDTQTEKNYRYIMSRCRLEVVSACLPSPVLLTGVFDVFPSVSGCNSPVFNDVINTLIMHTYKGHPHSPHRKRLSTSRPIPCISFLMYVLTHSACEVPVPCL